MLTYSMKSGRDQLQKAKAKVLCKITTVRHQTFSNKIFELIAWPSIALT